MEVKETQELLFAVAQELKLEDKSLESVLEKKEENGTESTGNNPENSEKT